ncbi:MAG TPA: sialidase family protein [Chloroflexia bacterium]|nr:sialidase family protein [Chloroflexia bacterium]
MAVVAAPSLVVFALAATVALGQVPAAEALYDVRANQDTTADQHEPTLAVDPTNPNIVLSAAKDWRTGPKQVWHYRSTDGGRTWADGYANLTPVELPNQSDPVVAFDADGRAYMAVLGYNQNDLGVGGVFVSRSDDKGLTWGKATLVHANSDTVFNDKEWMTVDRGRNLATRGTVYVSWTRFTQVSPRREIGEIVVSRSTDQGATFSTPVVVTTAAQENVQGSFPVVGPDGAVTVLFYDGDSAAPEEVAVSALSLQESGGSLYAARSTDGGVTFAYPVRVAPVVRPPSPLPTSGFRIFVLPVLAADPNNGALYATWNDYARGNSDILLSVSTDGGATWGAPIRVNDDPGSTDQYFPAAVVGSDGAVHLMWLDRRDDPANVSYRPYYARSTDGGETFSTNVPLSGASSDPSVGFEGTLIGDYNAIDVSGDGSRVYAAWADTRRGDQDIYFAAFPNGGETARTEPSPTPIALPTSPLGVPSPQPLTGFTDRSFIASWERADRPVLRGLVQRPWLWGPVSFSAAIEEYRQGANGRREVQYFDKARMEINNPAAGRNELSFVTNGLLVVELISGRIQLGDAEFAPARPPSTAPVAGDAGSPQALTYDSLRPVASLANDNRAADRTGQGVTAVLDREGRVTEDPTRAGAATIAYFEPVLGHNIPDVFWRFMNAQGPVYNGRFGTIEQSRILDWVTDLGYPITEPYWTVTRIGGQQRTVLVQAFQRRVLTYVAENPPGWQVEMGNVGRHYFEWRYGQVGRPASSR